MRTIHKRYPDPQRAFPAAECFRCGGELYHGDMCWRLSGRVLCEQCAASWLLEELSACRIRLKEVRQ